MLDPRCALGDENVVGQRDDCLVLLELPSAILRFRPFGQNLGEHLWIDQRLPWLLELRRPADDDDIRVGI
jgi:hypothetical protein